jgi:hypothetical protein
MLGIGCPDRHALPRITPIKSADQELRSPPARAGSFFGASRPLRRVPTKVRLLNRLPTLDLAGGATLLAPTRSLVPLDGRIIGACRGKAHLDRGLQRYP